jgi:WD40 repeat protein
MLVSAAPQMLAQGPPTPAAPVGESNPLPFLDGDGPTAAVTALTFSPDGRTLYSAGYDKVVRVWRRGANAAFQPDPQATFRVPIGPGRDGVINVLAVSPDGNWLAASGLGVFRGGSGFTQAGYVVSDDALTAEMRQDRSQIYLFNTRTHDVALLRGHEEDVLALAFAPSQPGKPQLLVSAGRKRGDRAAPATGRVLVWDVAKASTLNDKNELVDRGARLREWLIPGIGPVPGEPPPAFVVRVTPEGNPRVITAWGDGKLRILELSPDSRPESVDEPPGANGRPAEYTHTVVAADVPGQRGARLLTGSFANGKGYLQAWDDAAGQSPRHANRLQLAPPNGVPYTLPRAISLVSSGNGRGLDHAAVVVRSPARDGTGQDYRLVLVDLKDLRVVERWETYTPLGTWTRPPVVAASPDGTLLAVTGDHNREIRVLTTADLFGKHPAPAALRSAVSGIAAVAFVQKGEPAELGLILRPAAGAPPDQIRALAATDLVLDTGKRSLTPDAGRQGWKLVSPADAGWRVERDANAPTDFRWVGPQTRGTIRPKLQASQVVTAYALVPPRPPLTDPVLAVATWDARIGEPMLLLYDASSGQPVRQLNGHVQPIHSLAVAPDGKLLLSAADDQTVCVWGLTGLAEIVGRHSNLPGVILRKGADPAGGLAEVVVAQVDAVGPAAGKLAVGDVIQSLSFAEPNRKPRQVSSPEEFFQAIWDEKPGDTVRLHIRRGGATQAVAVVLEQGVDEWKPLVSLFATRDKTPGWIAWTPLGPYDTSGREVERFLGWHFNPTRLGEPVHYARADAYRERLHKPGLLKPLLALSNLTDALRVLDRPVALPRATILCAIDAADPVRFGAGEADQILVRQPRATLRLRIEGPALAKNEIESVTWRVNDGEPRVMPLDGTIGDTLTQPMDLGRRGVYRIQVCLRTREAEPQQVTRDMVVRYQPPPPKIRLEGPAEPRSTVREAQFRLKAAVEPGVPGQNVTFTLRNGRAEPKPVVGSLDESLTLAPGENVLALRAVNEGALAGYEEFESDQRTVVLVFQPQNAPQLSLASVVPVTHPQSDAAPVGPIKIEPGRPATVATGRIRVQGRITAAEPLSTARVGDRQLAGFRPNTVREFAIDEEVTLKPGDQELLFRAKSANSAEAEARLTVTYRPPLPLLTLTDPDPDHALTEGRDALAVDLRGVLTPPIGQIPSDLQPFEVVLRVTNGGRPVAQEGGDTITIPSNRLADPQRLYPAGVLTAKVRLQPGDNRIGVTIRNQWREVMGVERHVFYRRPPRMTGPVTTPPPDKQPFTDVLAEFESASDLTRVECNGREYPVGEVATRVRESIWQVRLSEVPITPGRSTVRLVVSNRDGPCLTDSLADVSVLPVKLKAPPKVELANRPQGPVKESKFTARFVIRSAGSRVRRVELRRGSTVLAAATNPRQESDGRDGFEAKGDLGPITLVEGPNRLRLVAVNEGGEAGEAFTVSYVPIPEWLEIDSPNAALPQAEFQLTGRVRWVGSTSAADIERKVQGLRVYVNNAFQQQTPVYRLAGTNRMEFDVPVVLNRSKENLVEVVCPDLRPDAGGKQQFTVDCARPKEEPRSLHLLVVAVGPGRADATDKTLALRALKALHARGAGAEGLRSTTFQRVLMHPYDKEQPTQVVSGYVTCEHVRDALESIRRRSKPNDIALIYWLGREAVDEGNNLYLLTSESRPGTKLAQKAVALKEILEFPRDVPGACTLLLDTAAGALQEVPVAECVPCTRVAVLRYAWSGKSTPVPGLMNALEEASRNRDATSLHDLAGFADRSRRQFPVTPTWEDNLKELPGLAETVISRKP